MSDILMKIAPKTVVTVSFIVTNQEGQVVGRTDPKNPVVTLVGQQYLVPGLEKSLVLREKGDEYTITLTPDEAYGVTDESLIQTIDRSWFGDFPLEVGSVFAADTSHGQRAVVVKEIHEDTVVVDANHPLSGQTLTFFVTIEDVRLATEEELAHGHAHRNGVCPSEEHHCGCGKHHEHDDEHHCCCGGKHHHHHDEEHEHHCCCGGKHHHHHDEEHEHHCGCGGKHHHHHDEEHEHHCGCGGKHHHHHDEDHEHHCCCADKHHPHPHKEEDKE